MTKKNKPMTIEELNHMTDMLISCRASMLEQKETMRIAIEAQGAICKSLGNEYDTQRAALEEAMLANGLTQMRRDTATVTVANKIGLQVNDPSKFIGWLKNNKYGHVIKTVPATETIDGILMRGLSSKLAGADKLPDGTERIEKAVMTVRDKKQTEEAAEKLKKKK